MNIIGYIRTYLMYLKTPKGRFDSLDYFKALTLIIFTIVIILGIIYLGERF